MAQPVPAATILLVRDAAAGLEVFLVERHHEIDFATGALVFPGFDTHFFLVQAPPDQAAVDDGGESVDSTWATPAAALAEANYDVTEATPTELSGRPRG
jgi:hypothetical protein